MSSAPHVFLCSTSHCSNTLQDTANSWQRQCAYHALANLEVGNLSCIPVYAGATYPLINTPERFQAWESVHGKLPWEGAFALENATAEALGNDPTSGDPNRIVKPAFIEGFPTTKINHSTSAANFMVEMVHKYPHQVSIYSAGALTNVALAVRMDSDFASLAKELVIMGGYVDVNMYQVTGDYLQADINSDVGVLTHSPIMNQLISTTDQPDGRPGSCEDCSQCRVPRDRYCRKRGQSGAVDTRVPR